MRSEVPRARLPVVVDAAGLDEDLAHASEAGRVVAKAALRQFDRDGGVELARLRRCSAEGRDGTRLAGCVKVYLPAEAGPWRMVFDATKMGLSRGHLLLLAFGLGHPKRPWQPSVYRVAHERLHATG